MANIVTYHNPLDPLSRHTETVDVCRVSQLLATMKYDSTVYDIAVYRNNQIVCEDFEILDTDAVAVILIPRGDGAKQILGVIAMIALSIAAPGLGASLAGTLGIAGSVGNAVMTGLVIMAGSLIINAVLPAPKIDSSFEKESQTYGWDTATNLVSQGSALPKLFGRMKITPPLISKNVETLNDKQYLNCLYAITDGTIISISDIKINDNFLDSYDSVSYEIRTGSNTQSLISRFENNKYDQAINNRITDEDGYDYFETQGDSVTAITVCINFPYALYKVDMDGDDAGEVEYAEWWIWVEYNNGLDWVPFPTLNKTTYHGVNKKQQKPFRLTFTVSNLEPNQYQLRCKGAYRTNDEGSQHPSQVWVEYIQEEISDDFIYPNTSLLSIRALATDQLSGSFPTVTCIADTGVDNPSDIALAMLDECGVDSSLIDFDKFEEWHDFCVANDYTCNIYFDTISNVRKALDLVGVCGRARVEQFGSKFTVIIDKPNEIPVQSFMFGMGNILKNSFKEEFLPISERANVIEVTYNDPDNDYEKTILEISNESYDTDLEENRTSLDFIGCCDRAMAIKHANYMLNCNRYLTILATFEADIDSLVCRFGDIVQVAHDVPQWGSSGRIVSCSTTQCELDRTVTMESGKSYYVRIKNNTDNSVIEQRVTNTKNTTNVLYFTSALTTPAEKYDIYSVGELGQISRLMRIIKIDTKGDDQTRRITCLEYNDNVYVDDGEITPTEIADYGISNLKAYDYIYYNEDRTISTMLTLTWSGQSLYYIVSYKPTEVSEYTSVTVYDNTFSCVVSDVEYDISIKDAVGNIVTTTHTVIGKTAPPDPVSTLTLEERPNTIFVKWVYTAVPIDFAYYEVQYDVGEGWIVWDKPKTKYSEIDIQNSNTHYVAVYAVDTSGNKSTVVTQSLQPSIANVTGLTSYFINNNTYIVWNVIVSQRSPIFFEIRKGTAWETAIVYDIVQDNKYIITSDGQYLVKSYYLTPSGVKIYSSDVESITIVGSTYLTNIVEQHNDANTGWTGSKTNVSINDDNIELDFGEVSGYYYGSKTIELPLIQKARCFVNTVAFSENLSVLFDDISNFDAVTNLDGYAEGDFIITPLIATSVDGVTFTNYSKFYSGEYYAKAFRFAILIESISSVVKVVVSDFTYTVDMEDRIEKGTNVVVPTSGLVVTYDTPFVIEPNVQITILDSQDGDYLTISNNLISTVDISAWTSSGTPVVADLGDGVYSIEDNDTAAYEYKWRDTTIDPSITYRVSVKIPKDAVGRATRFAALDFEFRGVATEGSGIRVDTATGEYLVVSAYGATGGVEDAGDYWLVWLSAKSVNQGNATLRVALFPAKGASSTFAASSSAVGTTSFLNPQIQGLIITIYNGASAVQRTVNWIAQGY